MKVSWLGITLVDVAHARALLTAWTNKPGNPKPLPSYGLSFPQPSWTVEDGVVLHAFAVWWNASGYALKVPEGVVVQGVTQAELTDAHVKALDKWAAGAVPVPSFVDVPASKALLVLWSKTSGSASNPVSDYGLKPEDAGPGWTMRDGAELEAFGKWWYEQGETPKLSGKALTAEHSLALKQWLATSAAKVPAGWLPPSSTKPPAQPPLPPPGPPPLPAPGPEPMKQALTASESSTLYWIVSVGLAVVSGLWIWAASRGRTPAPPQDNPRTHEVIDVWACRVVAGPFSLRYAEQLADRMDRELGDVRYTARPVGESIAIRKDHCAAVLRVFPRR